MRPESALCKQKILLSDSVTPAGGFNSFQPLLKGVKKMTLSMFRKRPIVEEQVYFI